MDRIEFRVENGECPKPLYKPFYLYKEGDYIYFDSKNKSTVYRVIDIHHSIETIKHNISQVETVYLEK